MTNLRDMTRRFLLGESKESPTIMSYIATLYEIVNKINPKSVKENHYLSVAKRHIDEIKKMARKMNEQIQMLEEQITVLEENKKGK